MGREIKFRAWDGEQMISPDYISRDGSARWKSNSIPETTNLLMQFTGLKDRNDLDIYEGDIVKWGNYRSSWESEVRIAEVKINPDIQLDCKNIKYPYIFHWGSFAYKSTELEIIGNIYEHPELLNK